MKKNLFSLTLFSLIYFSCSLTKPKPPKLVITFVIDQMRPDLLTRFEHLYTGGFKWLIDHGNWFTNTHHEHSYTATGPGHTAIGFGQYPGKIGVLGNSFYDRDLKSIVNCVEDPKAKVIGSDTGHARSFSRYKAFGLGDWLQDTYPNSKVIAIAGKDRSACILGGKNPSMPLYYNNSGKFISSSYYLNRLPGWVDKYNKQLNFKKYKDSLWVKSLSEDFYLKYAREDHYYGEYDGFNKEPYSPVFPIGIDSTESPNSIIMGRPWFEREILNLGKLAIIEENLGKGESPDLLFIGLSAMDWMIHDYGPFSQEVMDAFIKVDKYLGKFIEDIDDIVGLENVLFTLTSDHGGLPIPEYVVEKGGSAGRINKAHLKEALEWIDEECEERFGSKLYHRNGSNFYLDSIKMKKEEVLTSDIFNIVEKYLLNVKGISRVINKESLLKSDKSDKITKRLKNMTHFSKSPEIFSILEKGYLYKSPYGTSHGTPYDYDTHVPLIFSRKEFQMRQDASKRETVDIAPTIAKYLGILIPDYCDGKSINL